MTSVSSSTRSPVAAALCAILSFMSGCNAVLGIEEKKYVNDAGSTAGDSGRDGGAGAGSGGEATTRTSGAGGAGSGGNVSSGGGGDGKAGVGGDGGSGSGGDGGSDDDKPPTECGVNSGNPTNCTCVDAADDPDDASAQCDERCTSSVCSADYPCQPKCQGQACYVCRGQFVYSPKHTFSKPDDVSVTDASTKLTWQATQPVTQSVCDRGTTELPSQCTWEHAKAYCEQLPLNGQTWRLPTIAELESIVDDQKVRPAESGQAEPAIDKLYFAIGGNQDTQTFWSSSPHRKYSGKVWILDFGRGQTSSSEKSSVYNVRCVRGEDDEEVVGSLGAGGVPPGHFVRNGGTVLDTTTKLEWREEVFAVKKDNPTGTGCGDGWRLPSRAELLSVLDRSVADPDEVFPGENDLMSLTVNLGAPEELWVVSFSGGSYGRDCKLKDCNARCVRESPP